MDPVSYAREVVELGPLGPVEIYQVPGSEFHTACLQKNSMDRDSTGLRIHAGAYVAIKFLQVISQLLNGKDVIELGTGCGIVGLTASTFCSMNSLALTDGNTTSLEITSLNAKIINPDLKLDVFQLMWGPLTESDTIKLKSHDVIIGSELMYYKTDVPMLIETVSGLLKAEGVFLHIHHFRQLDLDIQLMDELEKIGLTTFECNPLSFLTEEDSSAHPEWLKIKCLVSGAAPIVEGLAGRYSFLTPFRPGCDSDDESAEGEPDVDPELKARLDALLLHQLL